MRKLTVNDIQWSIEAMPEDIPVRGNAVITGDPTIDREVEDKILADMEWNEWAWCSVKVTGRFKGILESEDYLGACSYADEAGFKAGGYYESMQAHITDDMNKHLSLLQKVLSAPTTG